MFGQTGTSTSGPLPTSSVSGAEFAEDQYFDALVAGDVERIEDLLTKEFLIVDVMSGGVVDRPSFIAALRDGLVGFERVHLVERVTRRYGDTAIIVGRTEMSGSFDGARFAAASRYTHVLLRERRRPLASGQRAGNENRCPVGRAVFAAVSNPTPSPQPRRSPGDRADRRRPMAPRNRDAARLLGGVRPRGDRSCVAALPRSGHLVFRNGPERAVYNNVPQDHPGQSASSPQSWWSGPRSTARPSAR